MACASFSDRCLEANGCDVTISVDGVKFEAHKTVLCSCSDYFRSVLDAGGDGDKRHFLAWVTAPGGISSASNSTELSPSSSCGPGPSLGTRNHPQPSTDQQL